jgi:predicted RNA-binding Zn-ribbon protein involved in translation (DUF1610 family)
VTESRFAKIDRKLNERRILVIDLERQAGLTHIFDQRTSGFIPASRWLRQPNTLCFSAKWYGQRSIEFHAAWDDGYDAMVQRAWELYDEADIVVTYNGMKADNRWLKDDWLLTGRPSPSSWKNIDLYKVNSATFGFASKSLAHLCARLGIPGKAGHYDPFEADACMAGDEAARRRMERYNRNDVKITEQCYDALRGWIPNHPHLNLSSGDQLTCPNCGGTEVTRNGTYTAVVLEYAEYRCNNCEAPFRAGHVRRVARTRGVRS